MSRFLITAFLLLSLHASADDLIEFKDGDIIKADDFNHNFTELEEGIANIPEGPQGPQGEQGPAGPQGPAGADGVAAGLSCATDQIIKFDGSAWVCVNDPFVSLNCNNGDTLKFDATNGEWICASPQLVTEVGSTSDVIVIANCPAGTTAKTGGCEILQGVGDNPYLTANAVLETLDGWICAAAGEPQAQLTALAVCQ